MLLTCFVKSCVASKEKGIKFVFEKYVHRPFLPLFLTCLHLSFCICMEIILHRPTMNPDELPTEADKLRQQATVIAISEAYANNETLEAIADPDHIVRLDFEEMADSIVRIFCPTEISHTGEYPVSLVFKDSRI